MNRDRVQDMEKVITVENVVQSYLEVAEERTEAEFCDWHPEMINRLTDYLVPSAEEVLEVLRPILAQGRKEPS